MRGRLRFKPCFRRCWCGGCRCCAEGSAKESFGVDFILFMIAICAVVVVVVVVMGRSVWFFRYFRWIVIAFLIAAVWR